MWKDFFYYSKAERRIIVFLLLLALILTGVYIGISRKDSPVVAMQNNEEIDSFLVQLKEKEKNVSYRKYTSNAPVVVLQEFDPNTADSLTFRQLGLPAFIARNILRYREKGGVFRSPEAFARIYGLKEETFQTLKPYIVIGERFRQRDTMQHRVLPEDSLFVIQEKYEEGTVVDLNKADTTELKCIPGIGSG